MLIVPQVVVEVVKAVLAQLLEQTVVQVVAVVKHLLLVLEILQAHLHLKVTTVARLSAVVAVVEVLVLVG
jgi:hypothetical protein